VSNPQQLFIGNLSYDANVDEIEQAFQMLNIRIGEVRIVRDNDTGRAKGFAFVDIDISEPLSLAEIISCVDGIEIDGRPIRASEARPRPERKTSDDDKRGHRDNSRRHTKRDESSGRATRERRMGSSV
jgi:RNA recognition motif-containing protein